MVGDDFGGDVGRSAALIVDESVFVDDFADTKVADLDATFTVEQDVVELDVAMKDVAAVDVGESIDDLAEDGSGFGF